MISTFCDWLRDLGSKRRGCGIFAVHSKKKFQTVVLHVEELDQRIVPDADITRWTNGEMNIGNQLWSSEANWDNGIPTSSKVAIFDGTASALTCKFDNTVAAANRVVAGIRSSGNYGGTLSLEAGFSLTVSSVSGDTSTGFKWGAGGISQSSASDVLIITGGGSADYNVWSGGNINNAATQSNVYLNGSSTLQITTSAANLGDNIIVGQDDCGGSTLQFHDQTGSGLTVVNNAGILVSDNYTDGTDPNRILFDTNTNVIGRAQKGISRGPSSTSSFIDNYGIIIRSDGGNGSTYQMDLPIRNNAAYSHTATVDLQSNLWISADRTFVGTNLYSFDQEGGTTIIRSSYTLKTRAVLINGGDLQTYGSGTATIAKDTGFSGTLLRFAGGMLTISADDQTGYGTLLVSGNMYWSGGRFECYVDLSANTPAATRLHVEGDLYTGIDAILHMNGITQQTGIVQVTPIAAGSYSNTAITFGNDAPWSFNDYLVSYDAN